MSADECFWFGCDEFYVVGHIAQATNAVNEDKLYLLSKININKLINKRHIIGAV